MTTDNKEIENKNNGIWVSLKFNGLKYILYQSKSIKQTPNNFSHKKQIVFFLFLYLFMHFFFA